MSLYVDVSHILLWNGRLSGIERVEYNIIKHYLGSDDSVKYIYWSEKSGSFQLKDRSFVEKFIKNIEKGQQQNSLQNQEDKSYLKRVKNKLYSKKNVDPLLQLTNGDHVVILDGLWDKNGYIDSLVIIARQANVHHIVYDMIPVVTPGFVLNFMTSVFETYMKTVLPLCKYVYAISENSAKDTRTVLERWGVSVPHIESFRLGDDILVSDKVEVAEDEEYILATGTVEVRKNYTLLAYMYGLARERNLDLPKTIIVGKRGWLSGDFQYMVENDAYLKRKIAIYDNVTDNKLSQLYSDSLFVLCPSYYEGWGLPVREALAYGKVTLASNTSSLPEAGGELAEYFSPYSAEELLSLVRKFLNKSTLIKREKEIKNTFKKLTWEDATKSLANRIHKNN